MEHVEPILHELDHGITMIDLMDGGIIGRTGCYVLKGEKTALVETGSSLGAPNILPGLHKLGIPLERVDYIIVTHIHLDHSGGVGYILPHFPKAKVVVHSRGARHLIDPARLLSGARAVYGDQLEILFGKIVPVPEERVLIRNEGETIDLGGGRILTFYDTPGHAKHHFSIYDSESNGIFTGDTVGVRYVKQNTGYDFEPIYPSTSPSDFDLTAVLSSIEKLENLGAARIYHGHFGMTEPASEAFEKTRKSVIEFDKIARSCFTPGVDWTILEEKLKAFIKQDMEKQGHHVENMAPFELDLELNAKGLLYSLEKELNK